MRRRIAVRRPTSGSLGAGSDSVKENIGRASALRGQGGSFDFSNQENAVIPEKNSGKSIKSSNNNNDNNNNK